MMSEINVQKENFFVRIFRGIKSEWMKIIFPSNEQIMKDSITVLVASIVIGLIIFVLDTIIGFGFGFLFTK